MATVYRKDLKHVLRFHSRAAAFAYTQRALSAGGEVFMALDGIAGLHDPIPTGWTLVCGDGPRAGVVGL